MISTLHGKLPLLLTVAAAHGDLVTPGGLMPIGEVRGEAFGRTVNAKVTLNVETGELLIVSPDCMPGSFRLGDLIAAQVRLRLSATASEGMHAAPTH